MIPTRTCALVCQFVLVAASSFAPAQSWRRHTIDRSSRGADGIRLADVNADGRQDIVTGWEEGGIIRLYLNPGAAKAKQTWPAVTVGRVKSPEDALLVDLDGDGRLDVVSCCEGRTRTIFVHWAPAQPKSLLVADNWTTTALQATAGIQQWMYAVRMPIKDRSSTGLIVGSKGKGATVGLLRPGVKPRDMAGWRFQQLCRAGWIMSLETQDLDRDGDQDVVVSDRRGRSRGVFWLENPTVSAAGDDAKWTAHRLGGEGLEVMFLAVADLDGDKRKDVLCSTRNNKILFLKRGPGISPIEFSEHSISNPFGIRHGKAIAVGDIDLDGRPDIVHSTNKGNKNVPAPAVCWMKYRRSPLEKKWLEFDISGAEGVKFDLLRLLDLDGDGDLDVLTCEERANLGVFWYENPTR